MASDYPIRHPRSRYHVCCEKCHFIEAQYNKAEARCSAHAHFEHCGNDLTIFDSMARHGTPQTWRYMASTEDWTIEERRT